MSQCELWGLTFGVNPRESVLIYALIAKLCAYAGCGKTFDEFQMQRDALKLKAKYPDIALPPRRGGRAV